MKLTAAVKLQPTPEQRQLLYATLERANSACNLIIEQAWAAQVFRRVPVHHLSYTDVRAHFDLSAQLVVRCIGKVVDAYKLDKKAKRLFKKRGAVPYDSRILNFHLQDQTVSIWVLGGREIIPFVTGAHQQALLQYQRGESDLVYHKGEFFLYSTCDVPQDAPLDPDGWLGVDLGIKNIATDSDGNVYSAKHLLNVRHRYRRLRQKLQTVGTLSAKRLLKQQSGRESRFAKDTNHCISKQLVKQAKDTRRGLALEDLTHIRQRVTVHKPRRDALHSWSFAQLRLFVDYKAALHGVPVAIVDPAYTSQACANCGHIAKANRPSQSVFKCVSCGYSSHADTNAAINIGRRAVSHAAKRLGTVSQAQGLPAQAPEASRPETSSPLKRGEVDTDSTLCWLEYC
jgi:putative transposase